jgi:N-acetylglucosamine-6-phosphate deacetylase
MAQVFTGAALFDGARLHRGRALVEAGGRVAAILPEAAARAVPGRRVDLPGGVLAPGLIDLQVNGGGGRNVDGTIDLDGMRAICALHGKLGATGILPTLITDTPEATGRVIAAGIAADAAGVPGFLGLHLEGPHLDPRRKGAHDADLIRPMTEADLARLCAAARALPALLLTVAPEAVTPDQIAALVGAGAVVSLGHSDCSAATARRAIAAGASCATHLFNAMSPLGSREPGLVGAVLDGPVAAGLIADGIHVAPEVLRIALAARPEGLFLVSDAMGIAGTAATELTLGGRRILRRDGRLTLADGTLAGADLTLPQAIGVLVTKAGIAPETALRMATAAPAAVIGRGGGVGQLVPGGPADLVHLDDDWRLCGVWRAGAPLL